MDPVLEAVPNTFPELFWTYSAVFAIFFLYLITLGVRLRKLEKKHSGE